MVESKLKLKSTLKLRILAMVFSLASWGVLSLLGCSDSGIGPSHEADAAVDEDGTVNGDDSSVENSDAGADGSVDGGEGVPGCRAVCNVPADCPQDNPNELNDTDNWTCDEGYCSYKGCNSDEECEAAISNLYGCLEDGPYGFPMCTMKCEFVADCDSGGGVLYDEDNYECTNGYCEYQGCKDDAECREGMMSEDYVCVDYYDFRIKTCIPSCTSVVDCVANGEPAYDEDNFDCEDGLCIYTGCNNTEECEETMGHGEGYECVPL